MDKDGLDTRPATPGGFRLSGGFPSADLVAASVSLFTPDTRSRVRYALGVDPATGEIKESLAPSPEIRFRLSVAPGVVRLSRYNPRDGGRGVGGLPEGEVGGLHDSIYGEASYLAAEYAARRLRELRSAAEAPAERGVVTGWSRKSRAKMLAAFAALDYSPLWATGWTPAMVTLTLPGDWRAVAPTGRAFKRLVSRFFRGLDHSWGPIPLLWKLEFQRRGAAHLHIFMPIPQGSAVCRCRLCGRAGMALPFKTWLSHKWAAICDAPDPDGYLDHVLAGTGIDYREGLKASDPKRLTVYFSKHGGAAGGKEYQHEIPEEWQADGAGPGRFWGVRHLDPAWAAVDLPPADYVQAVRIVRRWSGRRVFYGNPQSPWPTRSELRTRTVRAGKSNRRKTRRVKYLSSTPAGFVLPNDGPAFASSLSRALEAMR